MKLHFLDRSSKENATISVKHNSCPNFLKLWHYHPELELVLIHKSTGTRFIGDSIEKFGKGDLVLIGKNVPHMWLNDDVYFEPGSKHIAEATAIHFKEGFLGTDFLKTPEMLPISKLISRAEHGILFTEIDSKKRNAIKRLNDLGSFERILSFVGILNDLARHRSYRLLASSGYTHSIHTNDNKNLDKIYAYIFKNFNEPIGLESVAKVANMNPSALSRSFKRINRKTFSKYLNEIRVGYACRLLMENKYSITQICFESGFNNISNFNRQFKSITKMSPSRYLQYHTKNNTKTY